MKIVCLIIATLIVPSSVQAKTPEQRGLEIAVAADKRDSGFGNFTADMVMILRNRKGQESVRDIRNRTLEVEGDGDKTLAIFDRPRDVKNTAMLTYSHGLKPDD